MSTGPKPNLGTGHSRDEPAFQIVAAGARRTVPAPYAARGRGVFRAFFLAAVTVAGGNALAGCAPPEDPKESKPRVSERADERGRMVDEQIAARGVKDARVLEAMRAVPRHWFVPESVAGQAYDDRPLPIGEDQTISQPYIVALMTESLALTNESKVLEIGTGSGYQAAVLAELTPHVFTIEIVEPLADRAKQTFERRGYDTIKARKGDGYQGWAEEAPFDAIIVTCAPDHIPPKLVEQLKPGGRMCIPVGGERETQWLRLMTRSADGKLEQSDLIPVRFVPMTGEAEKEKR